MKVVVFCGGMGLRLQDGSARIPKPLMPVGDRPILLHLMKYYAHFGHKDFILCLGHHAQTIKEYFLNYQEAIHADFVLDKGGTEVRLLRRDMEDWRISFVYTGRTSSIGERLGKVRGLLADEEYFFATYGDQLTDAPMPDVIDRLRSEDKVASLLCVPPPYSTHMLSYDDDSLVTRVSPMNDGSVWINGGFFVFRHDIFDYMREGEDLVEEPFRRLIAARQLLAYRYEGFWAPMDTLKDKQRLDTLADEPCPPWAVWLEAERNELSVASGGRELAVSVPDLPSTS